MWYLYEYMYVWVFFFLKILGQLNLIDASENSEVKMFLQKSLKKDPNSRNEMNGSSDDTDSVKVILLLGILEWGSSEFDNFSCSHSLVTVHRLKIYQKEEMVNLGYLFLQSHQKPKKLNKSTHDMLAEIFKKIGSKENTIEVSKWKLIAWTCILHENFTCTSWNMINVLFVLQRDWTTCTTSRRSTLRQTLTRSWRCLPNTSRTTLSGA